MTRAGMLRALPDGMRAVWIPLIPLCAAACDAAELTVSGRVPESAGITHVWSVGGPANAAVQDGAFELTGLSSDTLDLRFAAGERERARMLIRRAPRGGRVELGEISLADGVALPGSIALKGGDVVIINELRYGAEDALPAEVDAAGTLLARSDAAEALMVRPADESLPDLRVVVTPGTLVRSPDGDPADLDDLEFGDSLRVRGAGEGRYVIATEIVLPRPGALRGASGGDRAAGAAGASPVGARESGGDDRAQDGASEREEGRKEERGRGRGKERGRGKGKGRGSG